MGKIPALTASCRPVQEITTAIETKSSILYLPLDLKEMSLTKSHSVENTDDICTILWSHRMEHDKNPELFFKTMVALKNDPDKPVRFKLVVLGESYNEVSPEIIECRQQLEGFIDFWGFLPSKAEYFRKISQCDIVVSTANHEFFGLSM